MLTCSILYFLLLYLFNSTPRPLAFGCPSVCVGLYPLGHLVHRISPRYCSLSAPNFYVASPTVLYLPRLWINVAWHLLCAQDATKHVTYVATTIPHTLTLVFLLAQKPLMEYVQLPRCLGSRGTSERYGELMPWGIKSPLWRQPSGGATLTTTFKTKNFKIIKPRNHGGCRNVNLFVRAVLWIFQTNWCGDSCRIKI